MKVSFPAMRGFIGGREYYSCQMSLSVVPKLFTFRDWSDAPPEQREQRVLNKNRIPEIRRYILRYEDGYIFSSITASYRHPVTFKSIPDHPDLGALEMNLEDAMFVINDGQHRVAAIGEALKENPSLGDESISVLLFPFESLERNQQMFSDLNRNVAKTSRSLDILYDKRDPLSLITLDVVERVPVFKGMVDKDATSLPVRSSKLFTLTALYDANEELLGSISEDDDTFHNEHVNTCTEYWTEVAKAIPSWQHVKDMKIASFELRRDTISAHSVVLRAIGGVGHDLMKHYPQTWKDRLAQLKDINWRKDNPDWENVCIIANSVVSNRQARVATRAYLKEQLGLPLTDVEHRSRTHTETVVQTSLVP